MSFIWFMLSDLIRVHRFTESVPKTFGLLSLLEVKESSNCHTMCLERKSCPNRIAEA